jgi:hypothetical protein
MGNKIKILAIDFDNTIVENEFPEIGMIKPYAKEVINRLQEEGFFIIIWSCRGSYELTEMRAWLIRHDVKFDKINENAPFELVGFSPHPKIYADIYIDDRNLGGLPTWPEIYKLLSGNEFKL